mgnify:CR=1 FL=1
MKASKFTEAQKAFILKQCKLMYLGNRSPDHPPPAPAIGRLKSVPTAHCTLEDNGDRYLRI